MRAIIPHCAALLLVVGQFCAIAPPAHAAGGCGPGETLLWSKVVHEGNELVQYTSCVATAKWRPNELDRVVSVLNTLPDTPAKTWTMKNVTFVRDSEKVKPPVPVYAINKKGEKVLAQQDENDGVYTNRKLSPYEGYVDENGHKTNDSNGHVALFFNDNFFSSESPATQRSLFAFESGKALFVKLDLGSWFNTNLSRYSSAMDEMVTAGRAPDETDTDLGFDVPSLFGGLFRAEMLQLPPREGWHEPLRKLDKLLLRQNSPVGSP